MTAKVQANADGSASILVGATNAIDITAAGKVSFPNTVQPVFRGSSASFTNTVAGSAEYVNLTQDQAVGVTKATTTITPTVAGLYSVSFNGQCTGATAALGLVINSTGGGLQAEIQPPYSTNNAYVSVSSLVQFNGTTDSVQFGVFGANSGCTFTNLKAALVLVRQG